MRRSLNFHYFLVLGRIQTSIKETNFAVKIFLYQLFDLKSQKLKPILGICSLSLSFLLSFRLMD